MAVWAILGLLAVYFAGARLVGRFAAAWAAALLAVSLVRRGSRGTRTPRSSCRRWSSPARWPRARAHVDDDGFFAPVAGVLLGLLLFLRFDAVIVYAALGVATVLDARPATAGRAGRSCGRFGALVCLASALPRS